MLNIIARKPKDDTQDFIVVHTGHGYHPFVVATANTELLARDEWLWGHYFNTREQALGYFNTLGGQPADGSMTITWIGLASNHDTRLVTRVWFDKGNIHYTVAGERSPFCRKIKDVEMILDDSAYAMAKR